MKKEDFIGVWKLVEYAKGEVSTSKTHLVVKNDILWEVWPDSIYYENEKGPEIEYTFEDGDPAKLSLSSGFKYLVQRNENILFTKLGPVYGNFPKSFEDNGNLAEYILEDKELAKTIAILPKKRKIEEFKMRGFGTLKYDLNLNWWEGKTKFQAKKIILYISAEEDNKFTPLDTLKERLKQLELLNFNQIAADGLLALHNEAWNEEEEDISSETFKKKVEVYNISLKEDGSSTIWLEDGDLFAGHLIQISLDAKNNVIDVGIAG